MKITIGIPAYNEEKNIGTLLTALLMQEQKRTKISEIIVVSSGSTDRTDEIVKEYSNIDDRIILIRQPQRRGKASAINEILKASTNDIIVLESADTIPEKDCIEKLCSPFLDEKIGMTGAHPIPTNNRDTFTGYAVHLIWDLHHKISLKTPKCGELIAFRKLFDKIPEDIVTDEAWIEYEVRKREYEVAYVPEAVVYNHGPETIREFIKQRRRIACGHLDLKKRTRYTVSTVKMTNTLPILLTLFPINEPKKWVYFMGACALEGLARILGYYDYYIRKKKYVAWEMISSTKKVIG
jgi:cellulose synthase/poly-beta-1,6-N-acetylglucosamine synthase-like glycosyltransferase